MTTEELKKYQDAEKKAKDARIEAEKEYLKTNGIPIGTKVKLPDGRVGFVAKKELVSYRKNKIGHQVNKITKSGKMHKTAVTDWWADIDDLEVVE